MGSLSWKALRSRQPDLVFKTKTRVAKERTLNTAALLPRQVVGAWVLGDEPDSSHVTVLPRGLWGLTCGVRWGTRPLVGADLRFHNSSGYRERRLGPHNTSPPRFYSRASKPAWMQHWAC